MNYETGLGGHNGFLFVQMAPVMTCLFSGIVFSLSQNL